MKKLKSILYFATIFVTAIGILFWIAGPGDTPDGADNTTSVNGLATEEISFDFGTISMAAGVVSHEFKVNNTGTDEIVIEQIYTSCMCTEASFVKGDIKFGPFGMAGHGFIPKINGSMGPNEEAVIRVEFDPAAHGPAGVGPVDRVVYLVQKNSDKPIRITFKAVVQP